MFYIVFCDVKEVIAGRVMYIAVGLKLKAKDEDRARAAAVFKLHRRMPGCLVWSDVVRPVL